MAIDRRLEIGGKTFVESRFRSALFRQAQRFRQFPNRTFDRLYDCHRQRVVLDDDFCSGSNAFEQGAKAASSLSLRHADHVFCYT